VLGLRAAVNAISYPAISVPGVTISTAILLANSAAGITTWITRTAEHSSMQPRREFLQGSTLSFKSAKESAHHEKLHVIKALAATPIFVTQKQKSPS